MTFGLAFLFLGLVLFFDRGLLAMGNVSLNKHSVHLLFSIRNVISECHISQILFIAGIVFIIGMEKTYKFFFQPHKLKGTAFFLGGILIVLVKWPIIGMIVESYGAFLLFG